MNLIYTLHVSIATHYFHTIFRVSNLFSIYFFNRKLKIKWTNLMNFCISDLDNLNPLICKKNMILIRWTTFLSWISSENNFIIFHQLIVLTSTIVWRTLINIALPNPNIKYCGKKKTCKIKDLWLSIRLYSYLLLSQASIYRLVPIHAILSLHYKVHKHA